jgi:hypothetical protein
MSSHDDSRRGRMPCLYIATTVPVAVALVAAVAFPHVGYGYAEETRTPGDVETNQTSRARLLIPAWLRWSPVQPRNAHHSRYVPHPSLLRFVTLDTRILPATGRELGPYSRRTGCLWDQTSFAPNNTASLTLARSSRSTGAEYWTEQ